jgi:uncharacterized protein YqiB (DUF1249 family)
MSNAGHKPNARTVKYRPNLSTLMNLCETNYMLLLRLLADKEEVGEQRCFFISDFLSYTAEVKEVTKYTSLITIAQDALFLAKQTQTSNEKLSTEDDPSGLYCDTVFRPSMVIRLYHDARMAEVISCQDIRQVKPRYDYPNAQMHHPDEKQQMNVFLKEWLQLCHQLGQVKLEFFDK